MSNTVHIKHDHDFYSKNRIFSVKSTYFQKVTQRGKVLTINQTTIITFTEKSTFFRQINVLLKYLFTKDVILRKFFSMIAFYRTFYAPRHFELLFERDRIL